MTAIVIMCAIPIVAGALFLRWVNKEAGKGSADGKGLLPSSPRSRGIDAHVMAHPEEGLRQQLRTWLSRQCVDIVKADYVRDVVFRERGDEATFRAVALLTRMLLSSAPNIGLNFGCFTYRFRRSVVVRELNERLGARGLGTISDDGLSTALRVLASCRACLHDSDGTYEWPVFRIADDTLDGERAFSFQMDWLLFE